MSDQVWTYLELTASLQDKLTAADLYLSLYDNDVTGDKSSVYADFNIAVDPVTSAPLTWTLALGDWTFTTDPDGSVATQPQIAQIINGAIDLYGYFVYDGSNLLKYSQRFTPAPASLPSGPNAVILVPIVHADSP
jgi:hypothetical protein